MSFNPDDVLGPEGERVEKLLAELLDGAPEDGVHGEMHGPLKEVEEPFPGVPPGWSPPEIQVPSGETPPHGGDHPEGEDPGMTPVRGEAHAAIFISDLHMSDGGAGDDFMDNHLSMAPGGIFVGSGAPGPSRARKAATAILFAIARARAAGIHSVDIVLNGDIIDLCELMGRKTTLGAVHSPFFAFLAALATRHNIYYLRGNHDFIVPAGPWTRGIAYANGHLETFAEHGDLWDRSNWPPGPTNSGSRLLIDIMAPGNAALAGLGLPPLLPSYGLARLEVEPVPLSGLLEFAAVDNLVPYSGEALDRFIKARAVNLRAVLRAGLTVGGFLSGGLVGALAGYVEDAIISAVVSGLLASAIGPASDLAGVAGASWRRRAGPYAGWLMVQGHTHVPVVLPQRYYNTGNWDAAVGLMTTGFEQKVEAFPFLLVHRQPGGARVEEFFTLDVAAGGKIYAERRTRATTNLLRSIYGYRKL